MFDDNIESENNSCPFCGAEGRCKHLMLVFDRTFITVDGGFLFKEAQRRLDKLQELRILKDGEDYEYADLIEDFLSEIDPLSDYQLEVDNEGGPGMSSAMTLFYTDEPSNVFAKYKQIASQD
jgi:hypothetical protein